MCALVRTSLMATRFVHRTVAKISQQWLLQYFIGLKPASHLHQQILNDFCEYFRLDSRLRLSAKYVLFLDDNFLLGSFMQFVLLGVKIGLA